MSDFTSTMAEMVARSRTPQAPGGGGGQRFFGSGGGTGIKGKRTESTVSGSVDIGAAKRLFGHMTPEMKEDAFKKMQIARERLYADDPASADLHEESKEVQKMYEKLKVVFPLKRKVNGKLTIPIRSPEQKAQADPNFTMDRAVSGQYDRSQKERGRATWEKGLPSEAVPYSEQVRKAKEPYKSPHEKLMEQLRIKNVMQEKENMGLGLTRDTKLQEVSLQNAYNEGARIKYLQDQAKREEEPGFISKEDHQIINNYHQEYTQQRMAINRNRANLGGRASWDQNVDSTSDLMQAAEMAVGGTLAITDNPKYSASYLTGVMSEIDVLMGSDYMQDTGMIMTDMEQVLPEVFQLKMGDLVTRFGKVLKRVKSNDPEDEVYYTNFAKWACDEKMGLQDSEVTGLLLGIGMGKGWTQEEMARNGRQYTGPRANIQQPVDEPVQPTQPEKRPSLIETMQKNKASNRPSKPPSKAFDTTYKPEKGTERNERALQLIMDKRGR